METMDDRRRVFIDTNILIYASISNSPFYQLAHEAIRRLEKENAEVFISRQVLREYLASMTRPDMLTKELSRDLVIKAVRHFEEDFTVFNDAPGVTEQLLELANLDWLELKNELNDRTGEWTNMVIEHASKEGKFFTVEEPLGAPEEQPQF